MFNGGFVFDYPLGGKGPHQNHDYWGIIIIISNNIIYHGVNSFFFLGQYIMEFKWLLLYITQKYNLFKLILSGIYTFSTFPCNLQLALHNKSTVPMSS